MKKLKLSQVFPLGEELQRLFRIMKCTLLFSLIATLQLSANVYSQKTSFTVDFKDSKMQDLMLEIKENSEFDFVYSLDEVEDVSINDASFTDSKIHEILEECLEGTPIDYQIIDKVIILSPKPEPAPVNVQQEKVRVSGKVTDEQGLPLPGVNVYEKSNPQHGVITDYEGVYSIDLEDKEVVLIFSFIGYDDQEITVNDQTQIDVTMIEEQFGIDEVVVTGYGTIPKEAYTGSATVVSAKKIEDRPVASFQDVLRGNSPGTLVTGTGQPGVMNTVRLRGISSMNASNAPLYVIDGVIMDVSNMSGNSQYATNPLNSINPSDIESMNVLKDAQSASQYGSRGANGVIVITTKKGKASEKPRYSLDMQMGVSEIFSGSKPDLVNKDEFMELWLEGEMHYQIRRKTGYDDFFTEIQKIYADKEGYDEVYGRNYYEWYEYAQRQFNSHFKYKDPNGEYYDEFFVDGEPGPHYDKLADTNWYDEVTRTAPFQKFNLSTQGGNDALNYYASLEYFNQQGILIGSALERYSLRMNLTSKPSKGIIHWGLNNMISYSDQSGPRSGAYGYAMPQYTALAIAPVAPVYLEDGSYNLTLPKNVNGNQNPVAVADMNEYLRPQTKIMTSGWIQLNFTDWLNLNNRTSIDYTHARHRRWYNKDFGDGLKSNGSLYERDARRRKLMNTTLLQFNKSFDVHNFNGYVGAEVEDMNYEYFEATGKNFPSNDTPYLNAAATPSSVGGSRSQYGMFSVLSAVNYSFNNKYYLSGNFRSDQSSRFAKDYRTGNFWSVSGAWRISSENFLANVSFIDNLKIKASYGTQGTLPSAYYAWQSLYSVGSAYMNNPAGVPSFRANEMLTWEENKIFNLALEARLFNRLNLSVDFYDRITENLLLDLPVSSTSGYNDILINSEASLSNQGVEINLGADIVRNNDFLWDINISAATLKNAFSGLESDIIGSTQIKRNGESYYTWFMPEWAGIDPETGEQQWYYTDEDGNNAITKDFDEAEKRVLGTALASVNGSVATAVSWKGLELSALFTYAMGNKIMDYTGRTATKNDGYRDYRGIERSQLDRWTPDNKTGKNPIRVNSSSTWGRFRSSRYLYKGDYLKLKNIKLQYAIPQDLTNRLKIGSATLFAQAENLWVATELDGFDPEITLSGFRNPDQYPTATTYTLGLKLNF